MRYILITLVIVLLSFSCVRQNSLEYTAESFLKERYEVRSYLNRSFSAMPEGTFILLPESERNIIDVNWPGNNHIKNVIENQPWESNAHYHFLLDISEPVITSYNQNNSDTMIAVLLLDHYFSGLRELGFQDIGTDNTLSFYPNQFACNTWFKEHNKISITGSVYINIEDKNAIISVDISEYYFGNKSTK